MPVSRRGFLSAISTGATWNAVPAMIAARGREAWRAEAEAPPYWEPVVVPPPDPEVIRLSSNENPLGPGPRAVQALLEEFDQAGRYPFNSRKSSAGLAELLAEDFHAKPENIVLGAGSSEILRNCARAFTAPGRGLVTADPTFDIPERTCELLGSPVKSIPVDRGLRLDLEAMARAAMGAGLVFLCNPNNPTGTVHSFRAVSEFIADVHRHSPGTVILVDEAYHEYVDDRSYRTAAHLALTRPGIVVSRTFSKAYGMAGLRIGYAIGHKDTIERLSRHKLNYNVSVLGIAAGMASFNDAAHLAREKERNVEARKFTTEFFKSAGYEVAPSQANFIFVDIGRPATDFREECKKHKIEVGRDFPPMEKTHARVSIGTLDEMKRAVEVFEKVLGRRTTDAAQPE